MRGIRRVAGVAAAVVALLALPAAASATPPPMPQNDNRTTPDELRSGDSALIGVRNFGIDPDLRVRGIPAPYYFNEVGWYSGGSPNDGGDPPLTTPPSRGGVPAASSCGSDLQDFGSNTLWFHVHGADGHNFKERTFVVIDGTAAYHLAMAVYQGFPPTWRGGTKPPANLIACETQNLGSAGDGAVISFLALPTTDYYLEVAAENQPGLVAGTIHNLFMRTVDVQAPATSLTFQNPDSAVLGHTGVFQLQATDLGSGQGTGPNTGRVTAAWDVTFRTPGGVLRKPVVHPARCTGAALKPDSTCIESGNRILRVRWSHAGNITVHSRVNDPALNVRDDRLTVRITAPPAPPSARTLRTVPRGSTLTVSARCTAKGSLQFLLVGPSGQTPPRVVTAHRVVIGKGRHRRIRWAASWRFKRLQHNAFYLVQAQCVAGGMRSNATTKLILFA